jgi:hypothetical protein
MDLNEHLGKIVESLIADITSNVVVKVESAIGNAVNNRLASYDFASHIQQSASAAFEKKVAEYTVDNKKLENRIVDKIRSTLDTVGTQTTELVDVLVARKLANVDIDKAIVNSVSTIISDRILEYQFPPNSIHPDALKLANLKISGDNLVGGIIQNFSSTGIDDRATQVCLTLLDDTTVIENRLLTKDLTVDGHLEINGNLEINGSISDDSEFVRTIISKTTHNTLSSLNDSFFDTYSNSVFDRIKSEGLDLTRITLNGSEILQADRLGQSIVSSNLQSLGELKELTVKGESLLAQTLYVTPKRVGINTIEPSAALAVWDDEIEIVAKKKSNNVGIFGTSRQQKLILTSNNKDNIILSDDGSAQIDELKVGPMKFTASNAPPNYVSERCHVVWNTNPNPGGPIGWICLGGTNWANFGIID